MSDSSFDFPYGIGLPINKHQFFGYRQPGRTSLGFSFMGCFARKFLLSIDRKTDGTDRLPGSNGRRLSFQFFGFFCCCSGNPICTRASAGNVSFTCGDFIHGSCTSGAISDKISFVSSKENERKVSDPVASFGFFRIWISLSFSVHRHCIQPSGDFSYPWNLLLPIAFTSQIKKNDVFCLK